MPDQVSLIKANPLLPAEDYEAMRKEGIDQIAALGSDNWTDYNFSDPGITILEAVVYAITDLAYRTGFAVKDLLAPENLTADTWNQIFYTARQILHNAALTIDDYRKLMIDVTGVRNAWITPGKDYEVPLWIDYNAWDYRPDPDCGCLPPKTKLCLGKLGLDPVDIKIYQAAWDKRKLELTGGPNTVGGVPHPKGTRNEKDFANIGELEKLDAQINDFKNQIHELNKQIEPLQRQLAAAIKAGDVAKASALRAQIEPLQKQLTAIDTQRIAFLAVNEATRLRLIDELKLVNRTAVAGKIVELEGLYDIMIEYEENITDTDEREAVRQKVVERLSANRNLCEDVLSVNAAEYEDFGIGASFVVEEYADTDNILAQVFFLIYKYFSPSVPFYTIGQMLDKGYQMDEVFEGPALDHGFVDSVELEATDFFRDIHLSDLINSISDIKGIIAITYLHLPFHGFKKDVSHLYFNQWIEFLKEQRKIARIQPTLSQVVFCKEREVVTYYVGDAGDRNPNRMLKLFKDMKTLERKYKLEGVTTDLPIPVGEYMNLEDYYPVTYSLPMCYGVSEREGLNATTDPVRIAQARQLRGYMLFFEQILSGYLVQLDHLRDLFSFDDSVQQTYFTRVLTEFQGLQELIIDQNNRGADHFDQIVADFAKLLQEMTEPKALFYARRNKFLNHMLARFSEDLSEYEALTRWLTPVNADQRLISDKIRMLKDGEYTHISSERGLGYNYSLPDSWDTANVSGAERRIGRLLGFPQVECRSLAPDYLISEPSLQTDDKKQTTQKKDPFGNLLNVVKLLDPDDNTIVLLTSRDVKDGCCTELLMTQILEHGDDRQYYLPGQDLKRKTRKTAGPVGAFWYDLVDDLDPEKAVTIASTDQFDSRQKADAALQRILDTMTLIDNNEGLHLVEHILLRPKMDIEQDELGHVIPVSLLNICLDNCDLGIGLGEGVEYPPYRTIITRVPPDKCYDDMPWVLNYLKAKNNPPKIDYPFLFQQVFTDATPPVQMKFRQYVKITRRIQDLREFGSERINYKIVNNGAATLADGLKYGFIIYHGDNGTVLAQSLYEYNQRDTKTNLPVTDDVEDAIRQLMTYFGYELDLYCEADPCDNNEDPYSFRATVVIPCWPKRLRNATFRNLVEKTIQTESPAHVEIRVVWVGIEEMRRFEKVYADWLQEMAVTEMPGYEKVNPLVDVLNTLQPCGVCDDGC